MPKGRQDNQKMKPYLVMRYLLKETCIGKTKSASQIAMKLNAKYGIPAEIRAIYRDIDAINKALYITQYDVSMEKAEEAMEDDTNRFIVYDPHNKGYYVRTPLYNEIDIRIIAESIYSSPYLTKKDADRLVDLVSSLLGDNMKEHIKHNLDMFNRLRTTDIHLFEKVSAISQAIDTDCKISFDRYYLNAHRGGKITEEKNGSFIVNPYTLYLYEGKYYLVAYMTRKEYEVADGSYFGEEEWNEVREEIEDEGEEIAPFSDTDDTDFFYYAFALSEIKNIVILETPRDGEGNDDTKGTDFYSSIFNYDAPTDTVILAFDWDNRFQNVIDKFGISRIRNIDEIIGTVVSPEELYFKKKDTTFKTYSEDGALDTVTVKYRKPYTETTTTVIVDDIDLTPDLFGWLMANQISIVSPDYAVSMYKEWLQKSVFDLDTRLMLYHNKYISEPKLDIWD